MTRSRPGASFTAASLAAKGFDPVVQPLLGIEAVSPLPSLPAKDAVLLVTSKNALRIFTGATDLRHWLVLTVGDGTAALARRSGFKAVTSAGGTSADLIALVQQSVTAKSTPLVHIAGQIVRGQICETLRAAGYNARRDIYYTSAPKKLPEGFETSGIDYVLLYSPLAAQSLASQSADIDDAVIICMSPETMLALGTTFSGKCRIAPAPNEASMFSLLD